MRIPCIGIRFFVTGDRSFGCAEAIVTGDRPFGCAGLSCVSCRNALLREFERAGVGDELAAEHCRNLEHHAGECIGCGHCDSRCPFGAAQSERMGRVAEHFGL